MGNKVDITTLDGLRKQAHAGIDDLFSRLPVKPDGSPVDDVRLHYEKDSMPVGDDGGALVSGEMVGVEVRLRKPRLFMPPGTQLYVVTAEGRFRLADPNDGSINALVRFFIDTPGTHDVMDGQEPPEGEYETAMALSLGEPEGGGLHSRLPIAEIARLTGFLFEPVVEIDREEDGRFIAEDPSVPGALAYGQTPEEAAARASEIAKSAQAQADEEERLRAQKRREDNTTPLTPEALSDLRKQSSEAEGTAEEDETESEEESEEEPEVDETAVLSDEIEALRTKADAREFAEKHGVDFDETTDKLTEMKDALRAALIPNTET